MNEITNILITGFTILIVAILVNIVANSFNILTWYDFIRIITDKGLRLGLKAAGFSLIFLFFIYPLILGATAYYLLKFIN